jgi:hypothetical protein
MKFATQISPLLNFVFDIANSSFWKGQLSLYYTMGGLDVRKFQLRKQTSLILQPTKQ